MSKIIGVTVGTPISPKKIENEIKPVKTVNNTAPDKNGNVNVAPGITTESDPTVPSWAKQTSKPSYNKTEVGLGNVDNVKQYSANNPPPYPVTSVNGKTGAVTVTVPTKVSELTNDSEYIIEDDVGIYILDTSEEWTFTLEDGSTVTKRVVVA